MPVIDCPDEVKEDKFFEVRASIGKEVAHPNTTGHHTRWVQLVFKPDGDNFAYQVGNFYFSAMGNRSMVLTPARSTPTIQLQPA